MFALVVGILIAPTSTLHPFTHIPHYTTHTHTNRALRKKHGAKARTNFDLNLIPRSKDPTAELDISKMFYQGRSAVGGNQASIFGLFCVCTTHRAGSPNTLTPPPHLPHFPKTEPGGGGPHRARNLFLSAAPRLRRDGYERTCICFCVGVGCTYVCVYVCVPSSTSPPSFTTTAPTLPPTTSLHRQTHNHTKPQAASPPTRT